MSEFLLKKSFQRLMLLGKMLPTEGMIAGDPSFGGFYLVLFMMTFHFSRRSTVCLFTCLV